MLAFSGISASALADRIWEYEYYGNGYSSCSGVDLTVTNVRVFQEAGVAMADVVVENRDFGDGRAVVERYSDCRYPIDALLDLGGGI